VKEEKSLPEKFSEAAAAIAENWFGWVRPCSAVQLIRTSLLEI
jgi:hypothetical protein